MNSIVPNYSIPGTVFSITALSLVVLILFVFRQYFRSLDFLQMSYIFALAMYSTSFSANLAISFTNFNLNFLTFCTSGDIVCTLGFQLSFGVVLIGLLLLIAIFVGIQRCCGRPNLEMEPTYTAFKGFFKWIYLPYTYYSAFYLASALDKSINQNNTNTTNIIEAAVIGGFCLLFPILQLIAYKCIQTEETPIWRKWLEFFGYMRLLVVGTLLGLYQYFGSDIYLHCVMIPLILYSFIHMWKGEFKYPVMERIIFGLGEAAFLTNYFIFKYGPQYIGSYDLDFFFLGFVLFIDILLYVVRACRMVCYGVNENSEVNPQPQVPLSPIARKPEKPNKYEHDTELQNSRDTLSVSINKNALNKRSPSKKV